MGAGAITDYSYQTPHISISASLHCAHSVLILSAFHLSITYLFHTALLPLLHGDVRKWAVSSGDGQLFWNRIQLNLMLRCIWGEL